MPKEDESSRLSQDEIARLRRLVEDDDRIEQLLEDAVFRERAWRHIRQWAGWISASIITAFALYKAILDLLIKKSGS